MSPEPATNWPMIQTMVYIVQAVILASTGGIIWWYTIETRRLRVQAQKQVEAAHRQTQKIQQQIEVQLRPLLVVTAEWKNDQELGTFSVHNIGNGAAITIKITRGESQLQSQLLLPFLPRGECIQVLVVTETGTPRSHFDSGLHPYGRPKFPIEDLSEAQLARGILLYIYYNDVEYDNRGLTDERYQYQTNIRMRPTGVDVLSSWKMFSNLL